MSMRRVISGCGVAVLLSIGGLGAATSDLADAAMKKDKAALRTLLQQKADVNAPRPDGSTALQWAARWDDLDTADLLIKAGANVKAASREGATALYLACVNGS